MKRVLSLVLALSMVMSMFTFSFAGTSLKDVAGTEYESAVEALVELGIVNGYKDGTYLPENVVSRSEMAKLLVVAAGLAPAAELAEGTTKFSDVAADHWATGYINVAAEYGYVMGDPDGSFRPDDTVSYAEAITMAIRVLGYKTVVEAKGTWPTNYIAKAEELDLLEDITYGTYAAGAARGNVALLIWNMLRTDMWAIDSESEGDGLTYRPGSTMLETKFKEFSFATVEFDGWSSEDGKIYVDLITAEGYEEENTLDYTEYEYAETDFYTFVKGSIVEVLVNEKDETLLSMVRTDDYKYVAGGKVDLDEKYDDANKNSFLNNEDYHYAYGLVDGKTLSAMTKLVVNSTYVFDLDNAKTKYIKVNGTNGFKLYHEDDEDMIVLKDGEFASIKDLEEGDVWSAVYSNKRPGKDVSPDFYMISGTEAEGKLTKVVGKYFENPEQTKGDFDYYTTTIGGEEYYVAEGAVYFEDADEEKPESTGFVAAADETMKNEVVTFVTDLLGRVVAVTFDGDLNGGDASDKGNTVAFYALKGYVEYEGAGVYTLVVENEDGEETLTFAKGKGKDYYTNAKGEHEDLSGQFALVKLNEDGEILSLYTDAKGDPLAALVNGKTDEANKETAKTKFDAQYEYDLNDKDKDEDDDYFTIIGAESVEFEDDKLLVSDKTWARVDSNTVVVTLVYDDNNTEKDKDDDELRVEFSDIAALEGMKNAPAIVITDAAVSNFARAKYVVIFDEVSAREDDLVGIVKKIEKNELKETVITVVEDRDDEAKDGTEYILDVENSVVGAWDELQLIIYSIEENDDGEWVMTIIDELSDDELTTSWKDHAFIDEAEKNAPSNVSEDGREAVITIAGKDKKFDMDEEDTKEALEDAKIYIVNVVLDEDESETQYYVDNYEEVAYDDVELEELDRLSFLGAAFDAEYNFTTEPHTVLIIRGMDK